MSVRASELGRRFEIRSTGKRPLTVNAVMALHRLSWAAHTRNIRQEWTWLSRAAKVPRLQQATVTATPLHKDRRSPQDVAACAPEVKAAIDGLVDAGVLPDDTAAHLLTVTFCPPRICGVDGLHLTIEEILR